MSTDNDQQKGGRYSIVIGQGLEHSIVNDICIISNNLNRNWKS